MSRDRKWLLCHVSHFDIADESVGLIVLVGSCASGILYLNRCLPVLKYVKCLFHGICFTVKVKLWFLSSESG